MNSSFPEIGVTEDGAAWREGIVEIPVLLALSQAEALEGEAARRGVTTGQLLRRLVGKFLQGEDGSAGWNDRRERT